MATGNISRLKLAIVLSLWVLVYASICDKDWQHFWKVSAQADFTLSTLLTFS